jgi:hypothetical protein
MSGCAFGFLFVTLPEVFARVFEIVGCDFWVVVSLMKFDAVLEDWGVGCGSFATFFLTFLKNFIESSRSASTEEDCLSFFGFGSLLLSMKSLATFSEASLERGFYSRVIGVLEAFSPFFCFLSSQSSGSRCFGHGRSIILFYLLKLS